MKKIIYIVLLVTMWVCVVLVLHRFFKGNYFWIRCILTFPFTWVVVKLITNILKK